MVFRCSVVPIDDRGVQVGKVKAREAAQELNGLEASGSSTDLQLFPTCSKVRQSVSRAKWNFASL